MNNPSMKALLNEWRKLISESILDNFELEDFNAWIEDGNAYEAEEGVWVEQTTQFRKKFTYEELQLFFKREYLS